MIFVYTAQHTGTWFTIKFLERFFGKVFLIQELLNTKDFDGQLKVPKNIKLMQSHFQITPFLPDKQYAVYNSEISRLIDENKTVIPVRDPMLALITREKRHPELNPHFPWIAQLNRFIDLADHPNIFFFPVDLYRSEDDRLNIMKKLLKHVEIKNWNEEAIKKFAYNWRPQNISSKKSNKSVSQITTIYQNEEFDKLHDQFGESYEWLVNNDKLKKFLKNIGYDLSWFKDMSFNNDNSK